MISERIRVRFAPSPTGYLHIGSARTALFNWLFARRHGGVFVLRIEDTDEQRNKTEALAAIFEGLRWLGLDPDEGPEQGGAYGPYFQSERGPTYAEAVKQLERSDGIYPCFCTKERLAQRREQRGGGGDASWHYDGHCRALPAAEVAERLAAGEPYTWRLKIPRPGATTFNDLIHGPTTVDHADVEDLILVRADGTPTYNFAVVIDDHLMAITHVIRGQDHLTNSFKQVLIYEALGWEVPAMGHISLILAPPPHTGKLSKRHGGAEIKEYQDKGYDPDGFVTWLAMIGWSFGKDEEKEPIAREELIANFDIANAGKANARMNPSKLNAISGRHIRAMPPAELARKIEPYLRAAGCLPPDAGEAALALIAECVQPRIDFFAQAPAIVDWAFKDPVYEPDALKALAGTAGAAEFLRAYAETLPAAFAAPADLESHARDFSTARALKFGAFAKAVRAALTGRLQTPPLFHCACLLGREETVRRIERAAEVAAGGKA